MRQNQHNPAQRKTQDWPPGFSRDEDIPQDRKEPLANPFLDFDWDVWDAEERP
jgi:hypothetical protein